MKEKTGDAQFETDLARLCEGLIYVSETDADVRPVFGKKLRENSLGGYAESLGIENAERTETIAAEEFFDRLTRKKDWHGQRERELAKGWKRLEAFINANLSQPRVLRTGRVRIDIYVVGVTKSGDAAGVKTKAVET